MQHQKKFLVTLTGPVGSGKSHIAAILAKKLKAVHIRTDDIRVELRTQGKSYDAAPRIAAVLRDQALKEHKSVIADFDAVLPRRQRELKKISEKYGAQFVLIRIDTPEELILRRLKAKHYTKKELFKNAAEAIRVYHIRKKLHEKRLQSVPDFAINNGKPLTPQIRQIMRELARKM